MPIACSDIEPLGEVVEKYACLFKLSEDPEKIAKRILRYLSKIPPHALYKKILANYSWEAIYKNHLRKLIGAASGKRR